MNNILQINTDKVNIYIKIIVKTKLIGKIYILSLIIFLSILIAFIFSKVDFSISSPILLVIFLITLYFFPVKYLLWNFFGKENIIINTKSISYSFDYGFIKTNLKTKKINKLTLDYEIGKVDGESKQGFLLFYNYREEDNLPEIIYKTNAYIEREKIELIENAIKELYINEYNEKFNYIFFSEN